MLAMHKQLQSQLAKLHCGLTGGESRTDHRCLPGASLGVTPGKVRWLLWHQRHPEPLLGAHEGKLLRVKEDLPDLQFEYFSSRALQGWLSARPQLKYHLLVWPFLMPPPPGPKLSSFPLRFFLQACVYLNLSSLFPFPLPCVNMGSMRARSTSGLLTAVPRHLE